MTARAARRPFIVPLASRAVVLAAALALGGCVTSGMADLGGVMASYSPLSAGPGAPRELPLLVASTQETGGRAAVFTEQTVTIPAGHSPGAIERPVVTPESARRHFTLRRGPVLTGAGLQGQLSRQLMGRPTEARDALVYVHGYNTGLREAAFRVAQIVADAGFNGAPVLFAWPSRNSLFSYGADKEGATASRDALESLLRDLGANPDVARVHVLAHSMGSWLAMEALRQAAIAGDPTLRGKLGSVMLAAPDLDLDVFKGQLARLGHADNISIFVASDDRALALSSRLAGSRARLGALDLGNRAHRDEVAALGVRVYDLTGRDATDYFRHGTFAEAPQIVKVIGARLKDAPVVEASPPPPASASAPQTAPAPVARETLPPVAAAVQ